MNDAPAGHHPAGFDPSRDTTPAPFWLVLSDQNYAIRFSFDNGNYAISFRLFAACGSWRDGDKVGSWGLFDGQNDHEFGDWEQAFCELDGDLKWDGCINWQTNPECMMHGCGPSYVEHIAAIFATIYSAGGWFYDFLDDAPPPMPAGVFNVRDRDRSGEADKTGTGLAEGESPGRETASPHTSPPSSPQAG